jgi:hypothetical protein
MCVWAHREDTTTVIASCCPCSRALGRLASAEDSLVSAEGFPSSAQWPPVCCGERGGHRWRARIGYDGSSERIFVATARAGADAPVAAGTSVAAGASLFVPVSAPPPEFSPVQLIIRHSPLCSSARAHTDRQGLFTGLQNPINSRLDVPLTMLRVRRLMSASLKPNPF